MGSEELHYVYDKALYQPIVYLCEATCADRYELWREPLWYICTVYSVQCTQYVVQGGIT